MTHQSTEQLRESELEFFLNSRVTFGKYRGITWASVLQNDPSYIVWADANVEWLKIPAAVVNEAQTNESARKNAAEFKQPYDNDLLDDYYEEEGLCFYDVYGDD